MICSNCNKSLPVEIAGKVRCVCSHVCVAKEDDESVVRARQIATCRRLGNQAGTADCNCQYKPAVYACNLHNLCMPKMTVSAAAVAMHDGRRATVSRSCGRCDDHTPSDGLEYRQSIRIVTSFAPQRTDRQFACLATWRRLGMDTIALQPASEIDAMAQAYEGVIWLPCDGQRPTIAELVAIAADGPILLINGDIAIDSTIAEFRRDWLAIEDRTLRVGCRWDVPASGVSHLQRWGIDAFLITPEMLADFADVGFCIGQPAWDYWIVLHYAAAGYAIRAKINRGLTHEMHTPAWTKADGDAGIAMVERHCGLSRDKQNRQIAKLTGRR